MLVENQNYNYNFNPSPEPPNKQMRTYPSMKSYSEVNAFSACRSNGMAMSKCCCTAVGDPGTFNINVRFTKPATPLERQAKGCWYLYAVSLHMVSGMEGICFSNMDKVASGVTSRMLSPVPPVVMMRLHCPVYVCIYTFEEKQQGKYCVKKR
jgi:hypothetical protein